MAWAERLPSGKYRGCWRRPDGSQDHTRRATHPEHPYARKRDAVEAAQEAEVAARRQASARKGTISASITWGEWWDMVKPDRSTSDTGVTEDNAVKNYIRKRWGEVSLNAIEQRDVKAWVADLLPGREPSYVRRIYGVLRWSVNQALDMGVLDASPCVGVKIPRPRRKKKPYTDDDYRAALAEHLPACHRDLMDLGAETGLRPGELAGLHADVCDLDDGWLTVSKVLVSGSRRIREYPKDDDERGVPLTDKAKAIIRRNLDGRDLTAGCGLPHLNGRPCKSVLVILNTQGNVIIPKAWRMAIARAAAKAKVPMRGRGPYAVRRAFFTRAARGGMDVLELARIGGHEDVRQTQEYDQETPGARDRLRMALGEAPRLSVVQEPAGAQERPAGADVGQTRPSGPHGTPRKQSGGKTG